MIASLFTVPFVVGALAIAIYYAWEKRHNRQGQP